MYIRTYAAGIGSIYDTNVLSQCRGDGRRVKRYGVSRYLIQVIFKGSHSCVKGLMRALQYRYYT